MTRPFPGTVFFAIQVLWTRHTSREHIQRMGQSLASDYSTTAGDMIPSLPLTASWSDHSFSAVLHLEALQLHASLMYLPARRLALMQYAPSSALAVPPPSRVQLQEHLPVRD